MRPPDPHVDIPGGVDDPAGWSSRVTRPAADDTPRPASVFVVDRHPLFRQGIRSVLETEGDFSIIGQASSVATGVAGIIATSPDLALVDVRLDDGEGVEVLRAVRRQRPRTRCIVLSTELEEMMFYRSVVAGAVGYLLRDVSADSLLKVCREVVAGRSSLRMQTLEELRRGTEAPRLQVSGYVDRLSPQEQRILGMVTEGLTNREIAERLSLAEKTVRNYVSNVLGKLGVKNRTQAATYVARALHPANTEDRNGRATGG